MAETLSVPQMLPTGACVYRIECVNSDKFYIGSAKNLKIRIKDHFCKLQKNKHPNALLQNTWNKYGKETFKISVLEFCLPEQLLLKKQKYLDLWFDNQNECMNLCSVAGNRLDYKHKTKTCRAISLAHKGVSKSSEHSMKMKQTKQKLYGKTIGQFDTSGKLISIFPSMKEASRKNRHLFRWYLQCCQ